MAFDFLGTFNRSQFERFLAFARSQLPLVEARRLHLSNEVARVGAVTMQFDKGVPSGYTADPETSYLGKLLRAYEVLGGNALLDLRLRLKTDPVYFIKGDISTGGPDYTSGGEPLGGKGLADGPTAMLVQQAKGWVSDAAQARFGRLERKIRRAMDYADQLQRELTELEVIQLAGDARGSLEFIAAQIDQYLANNNYRAIYDDQASGKTDRLGLLAYAPASSYDAEKPTDPNEDVNRVAVGPQKQNVGGVVESGQQGSNQA